jgi:hypothetical protein
LLATFVDEVQSEEEEEPSEEESYNDDGDNDDESVKAIEPEDQTAKEEEPQSIFNQIAELDDLMISN